ncbi:F0F1 ATP synthase subunit B [Buchnera aphidicola (Takecallis taiwana)]|uniref:F0F1 ATP synthase subunit B n=1 Tax=Buchnera aphidicola TaxID=9 RepID=UPI0031B6FF20
MDLNSTILGQIIAFILFIWFCMEYIWPNLITIIKKRQSLIQEKLFNINKKKKDVTNMYHQAKKEIADSQKKARDIINDANKNKLLIIEHAKQCARQEKEKLIKQANMEIKIKEIQLRKKLTTEISILAVMMAKKIIINSISCKDKNCNIENIINNL